MRLAATMSALALLSLGACNSNTSPGNDKEAGVDPAPKPAPKMPAAEALAGIAVEAVQAETMSDADIASIGGQPGKCTIRLTAVGFPSFIRDAGGRSGVIKLNGKLIPVQSSGNGLYQDGGLQVVLRPVDANFGSDGRREAEMIVLLPGAKDELGYRGYEQCPKGGA